MNAVMGSLMPTPREKMREDWETIKSLKGKKRIEHIWEYFKIPIIGVIVFFVIIGSIIYNVLNPGPVVVLGIAWDYGFQLEEFYDTLAEELMTGLSLDSYKERIEITQFFETGEPQMDMVNMQRFAAMLSVGELDIIVTSKEGIESYAYQGVLIDIGDWFPADTPGLLWAKDENGVSSVYGISLMDSQIFLSAGFFYLEGPSTPYLGVIINTSREELVRQAVDLLLK